MTMAVPSRPKIYHIVHLDRLVSIIEDDCLWSDAKMIARQNAGTTIGMVKIKKRRLANKLACHPDLAVGDCVPFYFCPRSVMLYMISAGNHAELTYRDGQSPIVHLEADLYAAVKWAESNKRCWAFTLSNAGSYIFEARNALDKLVDLDWDAVTTDKWSVYYGAPPETRERKQSEFLVEERFPWALVERIGVIGNAQAAQVTTAIANSKHRPAVEVRRDWYY
jgi:hypothetical protein